MAKKTDDVTKFRVNRIKDLENMYADEASTANRYNRTLAASPNTIKSAKQVRDLLDKAITNRAQIVKLSKELYAKNPIYMQVIEYMANMFMWRYKVTPHKVYTKSKANARKKLKEEDYMAIYRLMLEVVDGLSIETKFPRLLTTLLIEGAIYITTILNEDSITIDTLLLPNKYCRKIGETQYGTALIQFDFSYFDDLGLTKDQLNEYLESFSDEFQKGYRAYKKDTVNNRWQDLDPHFSTGVLLNEYSIPTFIYLWGGLLDYEKYQDQELARHEDLLHHLVIQTMPHYEDKLLFEVDEVKALHNSMKKKIDQGDRVKLVTTFGDVKVAHMADSDTTENKALEKAFKAIFNNAGFNSGVFTGESVEALRYSLIRDKGYVWKLIQSFLNFYTIAINNWYDFKSYQADIDILPISSYTYKDDIEVYKNNATLGVGKLDYLVASGIKQKNIEDMLDLETYLHLDRITPMQTSYTQTAEDRREEQKESGESDTKEDQSPGIEPPADE